MYYNFFFSFNCYAPDFSNICLANDVGRPCFKMNVVATHFSNCYKLLKNSMDRNHEKILTNIVNISEISKIRNERYGLFLEFFFFNQCVQKIQK